MQLQFYTYLLSVYASKERFHRILLIGDGNDKSFKFWKVYLTEPSMIEGIIKGLRRDIILDKPPKRMGNEKKK